MLDFAGCWLVSNPKHISFVLIVLLSDTFAPLRLKHTPTAFGNKNLHKLSITHTAPCENFAPPPCPLRLQPIHSPNHFLVFTFEFCLKNKKVSHIPLLKFAPPLLYFVSLLPQLRHPASAALWHHCKPILSSIQYRESSIRNPAEHLKENERKIQAT